LLQKTDILTCYRHHPSPPAQDAKETFGLLQIGGWPGPSLCTKTPTVEDNGVRLQTKDFVTRYLPPQAGNPGHFALSVQCHSYGQICLRSYFLDYDGVIHGTGEPRQATADDPAALDCERIKEHCRRAAFCFCFPIRCCPCGLDFDDTSFPQRVVTKLQNLVQRSFVGRRSRANASASSG
jgi:hypothetical protein